MAGLLSRDSPCVFTTSVGTPVDPRNDYREFKKLLARAGLPSMRLHDVRHTSASLLQERRVASDATFPVERENAAVRDPTWGR